MIGEGLVKAIALGAVRSGVMAFGGWLAVHGFDNGTIQGVEGSLIFLAGFAFQIYDNFVVDKKVKTAATERRLP